MTSTTKAAKRNECVIAERIKKGRKMSTQRGRRKKDKREAHRQRSGN